eukprot:3301544-Ditylum_brightwellii.AAC.1
MVDLDPSIMQTSNWHHYHQKQSYCPLCHKIKVKRVIKSDQLITYSWLMQQSNYKGNLCTDSGTNMSAIGRSFKMIEESG